MCSVRSACLYRAQLAPPAAQSRLFDSCSAESRPLSPERSDQARENHHDLWVQDTEQIRGKKQGNEHKRGGLATLEKTWYDSFPKSLPC